MMILSNEKIIFDGSATLNTTQTVNGIFYASGGFARTGVKKNDNVENTGRYIG
ncbi:hypothetical protein IJM86_05635 [bacterium]|nr:hypothetical protein [bacterium]